MPAPTTIALFADLRTTVSERDPRPLYELDLTDKPIGYGVGNKGKAILRVSRCPVCNLPGVPQPNLKFLHTLRYFDFYGDAKLSMDGACELPKPAAVARAAKRKL